ncbi:FAD-dependent oxidoreductase [Nocardia africana]|uniref:FAD binding domain n=1 Tax=Nocardia africana TaxID=134964 RepID=A0A378WU94_9NOCA|nr:FAD-dependent monooxygenase [Nocardia africana]MCC3313896.1 FAD-dependent monooxygenase [Nocardia africana]SUA44719.1 FAD binding domain [Nocardia africana]
MNSDSPHAVVLGAGIAGLLTAIVLAERFPRVTVLERDVLVGSEPRRGVPQARHLHGLMEGGRSIIETLCPGLTGEIVAAGAPTTEVLAGSRWYLSGLRAAPTDTGLVTLLASRPLLESGLRRRAAALPALTVRQGIAATGLVADAGRVTGVLASESGGPARALAADLVVDCTGRATRAPEWLRAIGAQAPEQDSVIVDLGYSSRTYRRKPHHLDGQLGVVVSTMPGRRGGGAIVVEGEKWHVTLGGMLGDHPPTDHEGFTAFAATLPVPDIHRIVTDAEPLSDPVPHRFRGSVRRYFERIATHPDGFLALGDSLCSFNPLYAQGMTVAAQQALALRACLRQGTAELPARFYADAARHVGLAWRMSTGADLNHPGVAGQRTPRIRMLNSYLARAHRAAHRDPAVARTFMRVANLVDPPETLLKPATVARILWHGRGIAPPVPSRGQPSTPSQSSQTER